MFPSRIVMILSRVRRDIGLMRHQNDRHPLLAVEVSSSVSMISCEFRRIEVAGWLVCEKAVAES